MWEIALKFIELRENDQEALKLFLLSKKFPPPHFQNSLITFYQNQNKKAAEKAKEVEEKFGKSDGNVDSSN